MLKYVLLLFACCFLHTLSAQPTYPKCYYDCKWMMGYDTDALDFMGCGSLFDFSDTVVSVSTADKYMYMNFTNASICDESGNLQFYTNGCYIAGADHQVLENGSDLNPVIGGGCNNDFPFFGTGYKGQQGTVILPYPGHPKQYMLIHKKLKTVPNVDFQYNCQGLYISVIDMNLNGGKGAVTVKNSLIDADSLTFGQFTATKHANGRDWWLLSARLASKKIVRYLLSPAGLNRVGTQTAMGSDIAIDDNFGQTVFSPDGSKYIRFNYEGLNILNFNRCTGMLSNRVTFPLHGLGDTILASGTGVSPNSRFLYISIGRKIYQFDLQASNIQASKTLVAVQKYPTLNFYQMQLAPDGKIYVITLNMTNEIHTIESPNLKDTLCDVRQKSMVLPCKNGYSLPNLPNFRLGRLVGSSCDSLATAIAEVEQMKELRVYPNPASDELTIELPPNLQNSKLTLRLHNQLGQTVHSQAWREESNTQTISVASLPSGFYVVSVSNGAETWYQKVIVQR